MTLYENGTERTEKYMGYWMLKIWIYLSLRKVSSQYFGKFGKELETIGAIAIKQILEEKVNSCIYIKKNNLKLKFLP